MENDINANCLRSNFDRKAENKMIDEWQKTKDNKLLEQIYFNRKDTIDYWAEWKHKEYLKMSKDDFRQELYILFHKAILSYKIKNGDFNTWLFTILTTRIKNLFAKHFVPKRRAERYMVSLDEKVNMDSNYNDDEDKDLEIAGTIQDDKSIQMNKYRDLLNSMVDTIPYEDKDKLRNYLVEMTYAKTTEKIHISRQYKDITKTLRKMKYYRSMPEFRESFMAEIDG